MSGERAGVRENRAKGGCRALIYAIIALVALAAAVGWLLWRCMSLRKALAKAQARYREMQKDRAIRQNLQHLLDRREAEIHRLRAKIDAYEKDYQEMESRASDLSMSLFQESGLRIIAEKEDGAKRMKMEQLEQQLEDQKKRNRELEARNKAREEQLNGEIVALEERARAREEQLSAEIVAQEEEINRLRTINARRLARRKIQTDGDNLDQVTLDDVLGH